MFCMCRYYLASPAVRDAVDEKVPILFLVSRDLRLLRGYFRL